MTQALQTILVSRPILFIGYSINDPDLQFILRSLNARYRGSAGDLWAILPDVPRLQRRDLWLEFGIRVVSYDTIDNSHNELLRILDALSHRDPSRYSDQVTVSDPPDLTVGLAQYAARLIVPPSTELSIYATLPWNYRRIDAHYAVERLDGQAVDDILTKTEADIVIEGPAGSGKSWSVTHFMADCAKLLLKVIAEEKSGTNGGCPVLPIRFDCQLYEGKFAALLPINVPAALKLSAASQTHRLIFLVDSVDEMPARYLRDQSWYQDLTEFRSEFADVVTVYLTRRSDLIPDSTLPCFRISPLADNIIEERLADFGINVKELPAEFVEQLRVPYVLSLACKLVSRNRSLVSIRELIEAHIREVFNRILNQDDYHEKVNAALTHVAAETLINGRETFPLGKLTRKLKEFGIARAEDAIDRLLECGLLRSEADRRLRFAHRVLTEYFTSRWIVGNWESGCFSVHESAAAGHLHNAMVWAASMMGAAERERFLETLLDLDYSVAFAVAKSAEVEREAIWERVFHEVLRRPPSFDTAQQLADELESAEVPSAAIPYLRKLAILEDTPLAEWAFSKLISLMPRQEVKTTLEGLPDTQKGWNVWNSAGPALGHRVDDGLLPTLKQALVSARFSQEAEEDQECERDRDRARAFESTIGNLKPDLMVDLLRWATRQNRRLRSLIVGAVSHTDSVEAERFIGRQFGLGIPSAIFTLYLRLNYANPPWRSRIPRFTKRRLNLLLGDVSSVPRRVLRWRFALLRTLVKQDFRWWRGVERRWQQETDKTIKRVLAPLIPGQEGRVLRRRVQLLLRRGTPPSEVEGALFDACDDFDPAALFSEADILNAFIEHGWSIWSIVGVFLSGFRSRRARPFFVGDIDRWVDFVDAMGSSCSDTTQTDRAATFVAENLTRQARNRVLARANDESDPQSTFILVQLVRRMQTVTTDDLSAEAGTRLLCSYLSPDFNGDPFPTLGSIATERFIREMVLPYARSHRDSGIMEAVDSILFEAGARHGIKYYFN